MSETTKKCSECAEEIMLQARLCKHCGSTQADLDLQEVSIKKTNWFSNMSSTKRTIFIGLMLLIFLAALSGQNVASYLSGVVQGKVSLDVKKVENEITTGIKDQTGQDVTVGCPSQMIGKKDDVFKCLVTDATSAHYFADVTVQSEKGDVVWQLEQ